MSAKAEVAIFEQCLGSETLSIVNSTDLTPRLRDIGSKDAVELADNLEVFQHLKLEDKGSTRRDVVLMKDSEGNSSMVVVCRDTRFPQTRNSAYKDIAVIGGCGIYNTPPSRNPLEFALEHTKFLSVVMARKCWMAGLELGGMKATIPGESDWEKSATLQKATGFLFSKEGVFQDAITGTDARQTPDTIANMAIGSKIGGDQQIAGMIEELDTPASCRHSLDQTYQALQEQFGTEIIPKLSKSTVLIEGFGRIGRTAVRLMLEKGARVIIADPLLTDEDELVRGLPDLKKTKDFVFSKLKQLQDEYGEDRVLAIPTYNLISQKGKVFCPCSTAEASLTKEKLEKLAANGVKVILSGANNLFGQDAWKQAKRAAELDIIMPPEILANCGSVTAAAMEPLLRAAMKDDPTLIPQRFVKEVVVPHIAQNIRKRLAQLLKISQGLDFPDIYTAGEIAFRQALQIPYTFDKNHILQD